MTTFYLVMGSEGEYSGRDEWPVALYENEEAARFVAKSAEQEDKKYQALCCEWFRRVKPMRGNRIYTPVPNEPPRPERPPNPFDPNNGSGDMYWVVAVDVRPDPRSV
jgi:hypothetical protein